MSLRQDAAFLANVGGVGVTETVIAGRNFEMSALGQLAKRASKRHEGRRHMRVLITFSVLTSFLFTPVCYPLSTEVGSVGNFADFIEIKTSEQDTPKIDFDVVSIRHNNQKGGAMAHSFPPTGDFMSFTNTPIALLILYAYHFDHPALASGLPAWTKTERYDLVAKVAEQDVAAFQKLTQEEKREMLQRVLASRFGLKVHMEEKTIPVYELEIVKDGPKLNEAESKETLPNGQSVGYVGAGLIRGRSSTIQSLANLLSDGLLDRQVIDKTGLTGQYNFEIHYASEQGAELGTGHQVPVDSIQPSIFTALPEQLGLKLRSSTAAMDSLVVDRVERPSEN